MDAGKSSVGRSQRIVIRDVHRSERKAFLTLAVDNAGELDHELGLVEKAQVEMRSAFSPGTWFLLRLLRAFGKAPVRFLVAEADGRLVGTTIIALTGPWAYVASVGVSSSHRRQGIAEALLKRAEEIGRAAKKPWLVLDVDADNLPARKLYTKLGWSSAIHVEWWRVPSASQASLQGTEGKIAVRRATIDDVGFARARSQASLALPLLPSHIHPSEMLFIVSGATRREWAIGPDGSPTYFVRTYTTKADKSAWILCVPAENASKDDAMAMIVAVTEYLERAGVKDIIAPVREPGPVTSLALESMGSSRMVESETWRKPLQSPPDV
jgi:GNAT superfamily N-acetyltransferase